MSVRSASCCRRSGSRQWRLCRCQLGGLCLFGTILILASASALDAQSLLSINDQGLRTGFQDLYTRQLQKNRSNVAADFDLDGRVDVFLGNPGNDSLVLRNGTDPQGGVRFQRVQTLLTGERPWGAVSLDYDNDGDYDLFVTQSGPEGIGFDYLYRNLWNEIGVLRFVNVSLQAGIRGPVPDGETEPIETSSANAVVGDYDRDGDTDIFVNGNIHSSSPLELRGRNTLWRNNGDRTFTDVTDEAGLGTSIEATRHSTFLDIDNDGDLDLYENNLDGFNVLWKNRGDGTFEDVTQAYSLPGEDLGYPHQAYVSGTGDFNQDGWQDIVVFSKSVSSDFSVDDAGPYGRGHALYVNQAGAGFANAAAAMAVNNPFIDNRGAMGCQIGDVSGDGFPDLFIGMGAPSAGQDNQLLLSELNELGEVVFSNRSELVDFPAPEAPIPGLVYPPFPYRTHGTTMVDFDNDGILEIAVGNGGPASRGDEQREPNRYFTLNFDTPYTFMKVRPMGDGFNVSRDAVGTRIELDVSANGGALWTVYRTLLGGSAFSAHNSYYVHFGLSDADTIHEMRVTWPDGTLDVFSNGPEVNTTLTVSY